MPRQPRYFIPNIPQHVIARGIDRQAVFFQAQDYALYLAALREAAINSRCQVHAYVLMTNHVHLLVTPNAERSLPLLMQTMGRLYVQRLNRRYQRTGTLWEGRYKASLVQDDGYLLTCQRYIELNPVRAGVVGGPGEYQWSSYACNALGKPDPLITSHAVYKNLHGDPEQRLAAYRELFKDRLSEKMLEKVRSTTNACLILGNNRFQDQIAAMLNRDVRHRKPGRPKTRTNPTS
jgi:putative transposase